MLENRNQSVASYSTISVGEETSLDRVRSDFDTERALGEMGLSKEALTQLFNASSDTVFIPAEVGSGLYIQDAAGEAVLLSKENGKPVVLAGGPGHDVILIDVSKKQ